MFFNITEVYKIKPSKIHNQTFLNKNTAEKYLQYANYFKF